MWQLQLLFLLYFKKQINTLNNDLNSLLFSTSIYVFTLTLLIAYNYARVSLRLLLLMISGSIEIVFDSATHIFLLLWITSVIIEVKQKITFHLLVGLALGAIWSYNTLLIFWLWDAIENSAFILFSIYILNHHLALTHKLDTSAWLCLYSLFLKYKVLLTNHEIAKINTPLNTEIRYFQIINIFVIIPLFPTSTASLTKYYYKEFTVFKNVYIYKFFTIENLYNLNTYNRNIIFYIQSITLIIKSIKTHLILISTIFTVYVITIIPISKKKIK